MMLKGAKGLSQTDALPISNRPHLSERLVGRRITPDKPDPLVWTSICKRSLAPNHEAGSVSAAADSVVVAASHR
jgi:hypothetical protein